MRIVMLSDVETRGGAAVAASRLATALVASGHEVTRVVSVRDTQDPPWKVEVVKPPLYLIGARHYCRSPFWEAMGGWSAERRLRAVLRSVRPDMINIHNLHGAARIGWSPTLAGICTAYAPVVWTLHDMWSFTGGCAYSYDCRKFQSRCDVTCPCRQEYPPLTPRQLAGAWRQRVRLFSKHSRLTAVAPSHWLAHEAHAGLWSGHGVEVIPNGLPLDVYRPLERELARRALGIDHPGPVLVASAQDWTERRKGGSYLVEATRRFPSREITLVTMGSGHLAVDVPNVHLHELGHVDHERTRVLAYSAADVFVHPAPADNLPNVVMEAIACGTPVVGFPTGGVCDMVRPSISGWLADDITAAALACAIESALGDLESGVDLRESCRGLAASEYRADLQAQRYSALFEELRGAWSGSRPPASNPN